MIARMVLRSNSWRQFAEQIGRADVVSSIPRVFERVNGKDISTGDRLRPGVHNANSATHASVL